MEVQFHLLQKFCQPRRNTVLKPQECVVRYEVEPGDEMQINFADIEIKGQKSRVCIVLRS